MTSIFSRRLTLIFAIVAIVAAAAVISMVRVSPLLHGATTPVAGAASPSGVLAGPPWGVLPAGPPWG
jgi:hypothetical protein